MEVYFLIGLARPAVKGFNTPSENDLTLEDVTLSSRHVERQRGVSRDVSLKRPSYCLFDQRASSLHLVFFPTLFLNLFEFLLVFLLLYYEFALDWILGAHMIRVLERSEISECHYFLSGLRHLRVSSWFPLLSILHKHYLQINMVSITIIEHKYPIRIAMTNPTNLLFQTVKIL